MIFGSGKVRHMIFLTEANEKYTDELEKFKNEVLIRDRDHADQFAGCMGLRECGSAKEWIALCDLRKRAETCEQAGTTVPSTTYFAIRESDGRLVGVIDLRHHIDHPILGTWGGHCGYAVRPSERGKGYAKEMLRLNIQNAKRMGIPKLLVVCDETNAASEKTILANGGVFENSIDINGCRMKRSVRTDKYRFEEAAVKNTDKLIACCGLDCEKCDARIATLADDNALREKTAALWSKLNGAQITPEMINCTGCRRARHMDRRERECTGIRRFKIGTDGRSG